MKKNLRYFMALLLVMVASVGWAQDSWVKTALTDLATGDIVVIVDQTTSMAMANNGGTSSAPTATTVELTSDKNGISSEVAATLQWVVTVSDNSYKFGVNGTSNYLYCTNTNNGVRVGTNSNNAFTLTDNFLFNSATSRYLGVYNSQDWRCYTSINSNIRDCVTAFYKKISASGKKDATASIGSTSLYLNETTEVSVTGPEFSLSTTDATVASVSGSTVTAVGVGEATITATWDGNEEYNEGSETFTVTVKDPNAAGEKDNPYTVAQARAAIDAGTGITGVYATGIVSQVDSYNSNYHSITYWISADGTTSSDQLEVYSGKGINGADFDSKDDILVGDEVIVYGNLKKYNTTYEFDLNNQLVSLKRTEKAEAGLAYETTEYTINKGESFTAPTLTNPNSLAVTYTSSNESVASVTSDGVVTISGVGTTTIKATFAGNDDYLPGSASYTLTVIDPNAPGSTAENPYTVAQARAAIDANASINGVYATGIVSKVDSYNSNDKYITYWISDDGTTTDQLEAYKGKGIDGADFESKDDIQVGDVVVIKGNLKKYNSTYEFDAGNQLVSLQRKTDPNISFSVESLTITQGDEFEAPTFNNENNVEVTFSTTNEDVATWDATNGLTLGTATGTATITATFEGNTTYKYATAQLTVTVNAQITPITGDYYEKVTSTAGITNGEYLIVYEDGNVAFDGGLETLDAASNTVAVTISDNKIASTDAVNAATFTIDTTNGTLKSASGMYIGVSSNSNGLKQTEESDKYTHSFTIDTDGNAVIAAVFDGSTMTLRYNKASDQLRFRYFKSGQQAIQLYKKVSDTPAVATTIDLTNDEVVRFEDFSNVSSTDFQSDPLLLKATNGKTYEFTANNVKNSDGGLVFRTGDNLGYISTTVNSLYGYTVRVEREWGQPHIEIDGNISETTDALSTEKAESNFKLGSSSSTPLIRSITFYPTIKLTVGETGYATIYYSDRDISVVSNQGAVQFEASTYKLDENGALVPSKTYLYIPHEEAVVLKGTPNKDYLLSTDAPTLEKDADNLLKGSDVEGTTTGGSKYYALATNANGDADSVGFYWQAANGGAFTNGAHKAYLALPAGTGAKSAYLFSEDISTGINGVNKSNNAEVRYNMQGQRVGNAYKGVVIKNGKKFLQK